MGMKRKLVEEVEEAEEWTGIEKKSDRKDNLWKESLSLLMMVVVVEVCQCSGGPPLVVHILLLPEEVFWWFCVNECVCFR